MEQVLKDRIDRLKAKYADEQTMLPGDILNLMEALAMHASELKAQLQVLAEGQGQLDHRLQACERLASAYREPRG